MSPAISQQGWVQTWVTSQWKNRPIPGQFSAEINTLKFGKAGVPDFWRSQTQIAEAEEHVAIGCELAEKPDCIRAGKVALDDRTVVLFALR
jgi:hypothetical protein